MTRSTRRPLDPARTVLAAALLAALPGAAAALPAAGPVAAAAAVAAMRAVPAATHAPIALDDVRVVELDADAAADAPRRCVLLEAGRIARIAPAGDAACRAGADVRALDGRWLLPGLIDMHAHLTLGPPAVEMRDGAPVMTAHADDAIAAHNALALLAYGVTTLRNPGGDLAAAARYRAARASGALAGPESFDAGAILNDVAIEGLAVAVADADAVRAEVAAQAAAGADWIKLYTGLSPDLLRAGIDAAHAHGLPAVAHLEGVAWTDALAMDLDGLVHLMPTSPDLLAPDARAAWQASARPGTYVFFEWWEHVDPEGPEADALVAAFAEHRPVFDATLVAFHAAFWQDQADAPYRDAARLAPAPLREAWEAWFTFAAGWTPDDHARARAIWPKVQRLVVRLADSGARFTVGTDMGNPWVVPGLSMHQEMALLVEAGLSPTRVLRAATADAADALGAGARLGRIAEGFEADLLVLDADPRADIAHALAIHAVFNDGVEADATPRSAFRRDASAR